MTRPILYLSPHLDDAVLSCAGRIARETSQGNEVIVATLFTGTDRFNTDLYRIRREEDSAALAVIGAKSIHVGLPDAPFRNSYYQSMTAIVSGTVESDCSYDEQIATVIAGLCQEVNPEMVYCPLGVGTHIDHRLCHAGANRLRDRIDITYYEDRPYAFVQGATQLRFAQLGVRPEGEPIWTKETADALISEYRKHFQKAHYVNFYAADMHEIDSVLKLAMDSIQWEKLLHAPKARPEIISLTSEEFIRVTQAISSYKSQIPEIFGIMDEFNRLGTEAATLIGESVYLERYWKIS